MRRATWLYIQDIVENMRDAEEFVQGMNYEQFLRDKRTVNAVLPSLQVIGEAAKRVSAEVRERYPEVPWREMAVMRDKITHDYLDVDAEIVWRVLTESILQIRPRLERVLKDLGPQSDAKGMND